MPIYCTHTWAILEWVTKSARNIHVPPFFLPLFRPDNAQTLSLPPFPAMYDYNTIPAQSTVGKKVEWVEEEEGSE